MNVDLTGSDYQIAFDFLLKLPMSQHIRQDSVEYKYSGQPLDGIRYNNAQHCLASHLANLITSIRDKILHDASNVVVGQVCDAQPFIESDELALDPLRPREPAARLPEVPVIRTVKKSHRKKKAASNG